MSLLALVVLVLAAVFTTTVASAATVYRPTGESFAVPAPETFVNFGQIGVDDASGRILVTTLSGKVDVYAPSGDGATLESSFGEGEIFNAYSLAIGQDARVLYVGDPSQGKILKYAISGTGPLTFTPDPNFTSPTAGAEPGQLGEVGGGPMAVDPTTGDLLVTDRFNFRVNRYSSSGAFVSSFNGEGAPGGAFGRPASIAVDSSGAVYVVNITQEDISFEYGQSFLQRFEPDGTPDTTFAPEIDTPRAVAIDEETGNLLVMGRSRGGYTHANGDGPYPVRLYTFNGDELVEELDLPAGYEGVITAGLAVGAKRLYAATYAATIKQDGFTGITVFDAFEVPEPILDEPTQVTPTTAHLSGTIDPLGKATVYHFEYSREGGPVQSTEEQELAAATGPQPVSAELTDLLPNSEYSIRLVTGFQGSEATIKTQPRTLKTLPTAPRVVTGRAVDVGTTRATLLGTVNPLGQQATYYFEYGTTTAYGQRSPGTHNDVAGNSRDPQIAHGYLTGLQPGTTYHYRLVAENATGVTEGIDRTFTTDGAADAPRFFEQVSPVEKGGSDVNGLRGFSASPDGETLMYQYKTAPSEGEAGTVSPRSSAWRGPEGWGSTPLDAPQMPGPAVIANPVLTFVGGISDDGTKAVTISMKNLAPGAVEGQSNVYRRDTRTGEFETMLTYPTPFLLQDFAGLGRQPIIDGTPDYSHVLIKPYLDILDPAAPYGALYEWVEGELRIASVDENGNPLGSVPVGGGPSSLRDINYLSDDGSKLFFRSEETQSTYVRIDGSDTVNIGGWFVGATSDGRWAFVTGMNLTPDSPQDVISLYRFDTEAGDDGELEFLTPTASNLASEGVLQVTPDGSSVFFSGEKALLPGAVLGDMNLYVWHDGEVRLVARTKDGNKPPEFIASPNGRWFAFASYANLTDYDTRSKTACVNFPAGDPKDPETGGGVACKQIYRYEVEADELLCASCPADGSPPNGNARMGPENVEGDFNFPRAMLDDGTVIFDTTMPLGAEDSNSNRDVYTFDGSDTTLISGGRTNSRAEFDEASADGSSIFFTTPDQLVGQDKDTVADVYVSRVNGGIAAQNPPPPRGECIRDDCKETPNAGPELPFGGSEALAGPGNVKPKKAGRRCGKGRQVRKVKGKSRCVKKQAAKKQKRANSNRRQGR
ncbi:MAG TPA: hypothetical protein VJU14_01225 [Solirubrobacterales bacterium]|nr:hypothetical protein [Solirubrobacterales bacterium]